MSRLCYSLFLFLEGLSYLVLLVFCYMDYEELICKTAYRLSDMLLIHFQYSFSSVFSHKTYVRLLNKYYFTVGLYYVYFCYRNTEI